MAKNKISEFDVNPDNNTDINSINIAEGCAPSGINNAIRQLMSDLKEFQTGGAGDPFNGAVNGTVGATTPASGAFTTLSASSTATLNTLSSSGATITGGSINGTTVGASTASTGAFTTLSASGVTTFSAGTVSAPAITTTGDTNTGIFFPAADTIAFTEGGTEVMRILSTGLVSIGMTGGGGTLNINNATAPTARLHVNNTLVTDFYASSTSTTLNTVTNGYLAFGTNNTERMRIDSSGNVGIGTNSPAYKLSVNGGSTATRISAETTGGVYYTRVVASQNFAYSGIEYSSIFNFVDDGSERMRISSNGRILINRTSNYSDGTIGDARLQVNGVVGSSAAAAFIANSTGAINLLGFVNTNGTVGSVFVSGSSTSYNTTSDYRLKENVAPMTGALATVFALKPVTYTWKADGSNGQGFIAHELQSVVPECVSGEKDATRIEQYEISPAVLPTYDDEGNELTPAIEAVIGEREVPVYQGIDTSFLVATLTAAIQELKAIVDAQAARIEALENK
jgi:hypothetical protein